jgi:transcriptional regulator with XRE-family HTH domain
VTPNELRTLRKELACTAKELAGALDLDQATVLAWEKGEKFPTKPFIDKMNELRAKGPGAIPRKSKGADPMKVLADPAFFVLIRKLLVNKKLRDEVERLAASHPDPVED